MRDGHVAIIGGSVSGLLAAGAASKYFDHVTVLERDELLDGPTPRKGAPQGNQLHVLLPVGLQLVEQVFPGIRDELVGAGCSPYDETADIPCITNEGWRLRMECDIAQGIAFRRALLEWVIRKRLMREPNVEIRHASATGLRFSSDRSQVVGIELKNGETVSADLVVDAGGRGSKATKWLAKAGYAPPEEDHVRVYMGYSTQFVRVPGGLLEDIRGIMSLPWPEHLYGGLVYPADNGVHTLSAVGMMKNYPPADREGLNEFLDQCLTPLIGQIARRCEPVSEIHTYHMPGNLRRRWEDLDRLPGRFIVVGDAVASFNPIYAQGMTMAATAAVRLQECLAESGDDLDRFPARFQESLRPETDTAFGMAAGADAVFFGAEIHGFEPMSEEDGLYLQRLEQLATEDPEVLLAMTEAFCYMRPEALERDSLRAKAAAWAAAGKSPGSYDPARYPTAVLRDGQH